MVVDLFLYSIERMLVQHTFIYYVLLLVQSICGLLQLAFVFVEETAHEGLRGFEVNSLSKEA